ncbi:MAG: NAD(P)H-hydrate epimerase [Candidatus Azotimanducaceae bacterium]|jgi:NAD(P)H-hydrate epimerase
MEKNSSTLIKEHWPRVLYRGSQVREIDRVLIEEQEIPGLSLMRRAASACCEVLFQRWADVHRVRVYCGSGNNAADGFIIAGLLAEKGLAVDVVVVGDTTKLGGDGQAAFKFCRQSGAILAPADKNFALPSVIVDALLGTGFKSPLRPAYWAAIEAMNLCPAPVLAVDAPSGLDVDTGHVAEIAVEAAVTVTFIALKRGLMTGRGLDCVGDLAFASLGADPLLTAPGEVVNVLNLPELLAQLPARPRNAYKNRFGHVLVVGGDQGMGGAPLMAALAAMRVGAGLVSVATHPAHASVLMAHRPELMIRGVADEQAMRPMLEQASLVVLGPGIGQGAWGEALFQAVLKTDLPIVLDADGLNLLSQLSQLRQKPVQRDNWILTPHPGEAARMLNVKTVGEDRFEHAMAVQKTFGGVAVLKGAGTLVASATSMALCPYGNPGMSTAGMGDVLSGVIGGIWAQFPDIMQAASLGVALHSAAGDRAAIAGERGLMATDLIPIVRDLLNGV